MVNGARGMLADGLKVEQVAKYSGLSLDEVQELTREAKVQNILDELEKFLTDGTSSVYAGGVFFKIFLDFLYIFEFQSLSVAALRAHRGSY